MTEEEEKIEVLTFLMLLQAVVYKYDQIADVKWFMAKRTKQFAKTTVDVIIRDHSGAIKALWDEDGVQMPEITRRIDEFSLAISKTQYFNYPYASALLRSLEDGEFNEVFNINDYEQQSTTGIDERP